MINIDKIIIAIKSDERGDEYVEVCANCELPEIEFISGIVSSEVDRRINLDLGMKIKLSEYIK